MCFFRGHCACVEELLAWLAAQIDISFERGELVQVQDVNSLMSCWILQLSLEQHSTGSSISLAFAAASFCGCSEFLVCVVVLTFHGFIPAAAF